VHEISVPAPPQAAPPRADHRIVNLFAIWGLLSMVSCVISTADAGTCWTYADGPNVVSACENGAYSVTDSHGRARQYGEMNGGFERYPGSAPEARVSASRRLIQLGKVL
jgi:hypothetical protein